MRKQGPSKMWDIQKLSSLICPPTARTMKDTGAHWRAAADAQPGRVAEHALIFNVLTQAVRDFAGVAAPTANEKRTAEVWLFLSRSTAPMSFSWVCAHLDFEPGPLRRRILELAKVGMGHADKNPDLHKTMRLLGT